MAILKKELAKKKKWYHIVADELFDNAVIGESLVEKPQDLVGKRLLLNLMTLIGDVKKQNAWIKFEVVGVNDQKGQAKVIGYNISQSSMRRVVRRGRDRIDHSMAVQTKEGLILRIKFLLITRSNLTHSALAALRRKSVQTIQQYAIAHTFRDIIVDVVEGKLQDILRSALHKIYPLKICEIKAMNIEGNSKSPLAPPQVASAATSATPVDKKEKYELEVQAPKSIEVQQEKALVAEEPTAPAEPPETTTSPAEKKPKKKKAAVEEAPATQSEPVEIPAQ